MERTGLEVWGVVEDGEEKKIHCFHTSTELAVCDKTLLQLRYRPDVWAKQSQLISQAFIDNENLEEGAGKWLSVTVS